MSISTRSVFAQNSSHSVRPADRRGLLVALVGLFCLSTTALCQQAGAPAAKPRLNQPAAAQVGSAPAKSFEALADEALLAMRQRAGELKVEGVAVVSYSEGESVQAWSSKMAVVGRMRVEPGPTDKGSNLLAIAYAKAAEMADTLKDSGSHMREPMTGEFGWSGGVIARGRHGYLIVAFSGGKSEDDVMVSRAGLERLKTGL